MSEQTTSAESGSARDRGHDARRATPRRSLADVIVSPRAAVDILAEQGEGRIRDLLPLRMERMLQDPFAFYRGSAAVMAADLAEGPSSGLDVVSCGDAHLSNFGLYAAPDRSLVFDLNDFDEVAYAPAEWDLKRLVTSVVIGGRQLGHRRRAVLAAASDAVDAYRAALARMLTLSPLERYYLRVEPDQLRSADAVELRRVIDRTSRRARERTSTRAYERLTEPDETGTLRLREMPPVLQHLPATDEAELARLLRDYQGSVSIDVANLLTQYDLSDLALRVVGVGSVGTRCYLAILTCPDATPLILQVKQASRSVLETYGGRTPTRALAAVVARRGEGGRVVAGQRIMQAASDVFLGTVRHGGDDFYVRQFHDMKGSVELERMTTAEFAAYATGCARVLARAHAQSPGAAPVDSYLGRSRAVTEALVTWCVGYADTSQRNYEATCAAHGVQPAVTPG